MSVAAFRPDASREPHGYPVVVRVTHWGTALAVILLIGSGWRIYDQEPVMGFAYFIPLWATLGGDLSRSLAINGDTGFANALMWHFAAACLLVASFPIYLAYGIASRRFRLHWFPITPSALARDAMAAATFPLRHRPGHYNAVQRLLYILVVLALLTMIASGLAIWKPVQLWWLRSLVGGFQNARLVHFLGMCGITAFTAVHVVMALAVPRAIQAMIVGHASTRP